MRFQRLSRLRELCAPLLAEALAKDPCDIVRHEAAFLIGDNFARLREMEQPLKEAALNDDSVLVRHEACLALAKFKTASALDVLLKCMNDKSPEVRSSASYAIEQRVLES